jgi:hypothetical protein
VRPHLRNVADHFDSRRPRKRLHRFRGTAADDPETRLRPPPTDLRPNLFCKPEHAFHIGAVIERPNEYARVRFRNRIRPRVDIEIHAVRNGDDIGRGSDLSIEFCFRVGRQHNPVGPIPNPPFERPQASSFKGVELPLWPRGPLGVLKKFLAIDIDEIHELRGDRERLEVRRHTRAERHAGVKWNFGVPLIHGFAKPTTCEQSFGGRSAARETCGRLRPAAAADGNDLDPLGKRFQQAPRFVGDRLIGKRRKMHAAERRQMAKQVERTDAIPFVRRMRNAMNKKKYVHDALPSGSADLAGWKGMNSPSRT